MSTTHPSDGVLPRAKERIVVSALTLASFAMALNANVLGPLFPFLEGELRIDAGQMGVLLGAPTFAGALAALWLGPFVDRVGRARPLALGLVAFAIASLLHLWATSYAALLALRIVSGFAVGLAFTSASAAVSDLVPYRRLGRAMGLFSAGMFLAFALGIPLAVWLAQHGRWRQAFVLQALVAALALAAIRLPAGLGKSEQRVSVWLVLRERSVVPALIAVALSVGAFFASVQFAGKWLDERGLVQKEDQLALWALLGLLSAIGSIFIARLSDTLGKRNFVLLSTFLVGFLLLMLARVETTRGLWLVGVPLAMVGASRTGTSQALVSELVEPRMRGTLMGLRSAAVNAGMAVCSLTGGAIVEGFGYVRFLWWSCLLMFVSYMLVRMFVRRGL